MALGPIARVAAQLVVAGIAVMAKALPSAYQQALNNAKKGGGAAAANAAKDGGFMARKVMARDEALQVLNITEAECTAEAVQKVRILWVGRYRGTRPMYERASVGRAIARQKQVRQRRAICMWSTTGLKLH